MGRAAGLRTTSRDRRFAAVFGIGRGATATLPNGHPARMDFEHWDDVMDARRGSGTQPGERAPLPPGASELERYVWEHSEHPGFRAVADLPHKDWALISCKHPGEMVDEVLAPFTEALPVLARYGVELIPREVSCGRPAGVLFTAENHDAWQPTISMPASMMPPLGPVTTAADVPVSCWEVVLGFRTV
jgi:hypothetical protein